MKTSRLTPAAVAAFALLCALATSGAQVQAEAARTTEVKAELQATRAAGTLRVFTGEDSGSFHLARQGSAPVATLAARPVRQDSVVAARSPAHMCASPAVGDTEAPVAQLQIR